MEDSVILKIKRGYLNEDFKFFHLKDKKAEEHIFHYHDFNKIVIFISGNVTYAIEGKYYKLKPWDILFVSSNEVHKPIIDPDEYYERIIIWVNSNFLEEHSIDEGNLLSCFLVGEREKLNLFRLRPNNLNIIKDNLFLLEKTIIDREFGWKILRNSFFMQLIVYLNRLMLEPKKEKDEKDIKYDKRVVKILTYINENLNGNLSIDSIASKFYINRYYLMHNFKNETGYTIHSYILEKRLAKAATLIKKGQKATSVSTQCGFNDYSSFVRAFKKNFGLSPKQYYNAIESIKESYVSDIFEDISFYPYRE
ncbi:MULTISPECIES: AraC family transcriptional regulator [Clostridium]|uniref:Helix-turn-helix transcriptional regulator n=1 Tax=Clostridium cibarium TaxID=2762247 RepID=A0ABR8PVN1_9CLOT|nr:MULTISPECIES: AraC family transcriptional regulator [Clostridium]MBD7912209.1 helix-turn-helix transcriptional regulator [Clostridium cibarium]